jgi:hypothetical protein
MSLMDAFDSRDLRHRALALRNQAEDAGGDLLDRAGHAVGSLRKVAEPALHKAADMAVHEGGALARYASRRALRAGRAVRDDPMPALIGAVGIALIATMIFSRRGRSSRS